MPKLDWSFVSFVCELEAIWIRTFELVLQISVTFEKEEENLDSLKKILVINYSLWSEKILKANQVII